MGTINYGPRVTLDVDDRTLAHLQIVIIGKLRRSEAFAFSWRASDSDGAGRRTLWMHPNVDLEFIFSGAQQNVINRTWLARLNEAANSNSGLHLLEEPDDVSSGPSSANRIGH